jgi:dolichol-phosphate mannosyltransferase
MCWSWMTILPTARAVGAMSELRETLGLRCIHRAGKLGLGTATIAAAKFAIEHDYDVFVTLDADWSHDPRHLPELIAALANVDVAIGSRYCTGGRIEGWSAPRRVVSRAMNSLTRLLLRLPARDTSGAFRAYRVAKLREIDLDDIRAAGYAYLEEILWLLHRAGARFAEVSITFHERRAGRSKVNIREAVGKIGTLLRLSARRSSS